MIGAALGQRPIYLERQWSSNRPLRKGQMNPNRPEIANLIATPNCITFGFIAILKLAHVRLRRPAYCSAVVARSAGNLTSTETRLASIFACC